MILGEVFNHIVTYKNGFYDKIFVDSISSFFIDNKDILKNSFKSKLNIDFDIFFDKKRLKTIVEIEEKIIAPSFGFKDRNDYHNRASCIHRIPKIKIPTVFMHSKDDPVYGKKAVDY